MKRSLRRIIGILALAAFAGSVAGMTPCLDEDACGHHCDTSETPECPASDRHDDPETSPQSCGCACHLPGVAMTPHVVVATASPATQGPLVPGVTLCSGFLDSLFRPPRT